MDGGGAGVKRKERTRPGGCDLRHILFEVLREFQALRLVVRADALAIELIGNFGEPVVDEAPDDLPVLEDEGNVEAAHLEHRLGTWHLTFGIAEAWIEEAGIVHAVLADQ